LAAALMAVRGVRRSCETEESKAARRTSVRCSTSMRKFSRCKRASSIRAVTWSRKVQKKDVGTLEWACSSSRRSSSINRRGSSSTRRRSTPTTFCPTLEWDEAQRPAYRPSLRSTLHEHALYKTGSCRRGEEIFVVETHGTAVLHHTGSDRLLIGGEHDLLHRMVGDRLHLQGTCRIRQQNEAVIHCPGGHHVTVLLSNFS